MTSAAPIDFNDTEIAFRSRSSWELRKAKAFFQLIGVPLVVSAGPRLAARALDFGLPITPVIRRTVFDLFCGGVTLEDCEKKVRELARHGVRSILDYSVEGLGREADFDATRDEVLRTIERSGRDAAVPFAVFKVTGLARFDLLAKVSAGEALSGEEAAEWRRVEERFHALTRAAARGGTRIMVDAEESWIQPAIDGLVLQAMRELNRERPVVYTTLQMYLVGRFADLEALHALGRREGFKPGIKLVRGAYMEKERERAARLSLASPVQPDKAASDRAFDQAAEFILERLDELALVAGTHNEASCQRLTQLMTARGLRPNQAGVDFSQLLGMGDHLTYNLAHYGFNVAKYVPYGPVRAVMPYLARRAEENTSIKGQAGRELQLIVRELARRAKV